VLQRIQRDQLDGAGSGMLCEKLGPSMRALRIPGLFRNREEVRHVAGQLRPTLEEEFQRQGFVYFGHAVLGQIMVAGRAPLHNLSELRKMRLWTWDYDEITRAVFREMGMNLVPASVESAAGLYGDGKVDGFFAMPSSLLAFQWSAQAHYVTDVKSNYLLGCLMLTSKALNKLPQAHRDVIRAATARLSARLESVGAEMDDKLLSGLFGRQGLQATPVNDAFRTEFWNEARAASERLGNKLVPPPLLKRVNELLADYRAAHPEQARR
jgi:TRAP-type C4-dicarboxylate transport system substrate-binding protein